MGTRALPAPRGGAPAGQRRPLPAWRARAAATAAPPRGAAGHTAPGPAGAPRPPAPAGPGLAQARRAAPAPQPRHKG